MTKTLILTRHAKSSWEDVNQSDHERPLNSRGRRSAPLIAAWLAGQGVAPDEVLCSTARRTQETWALMAEGLPKAPEPTLLETLYLAHPSKMLDILKQASGATVAMIGHNPGTASLAWSLVSTPPTHPKFGHYPTAATTIIDFNIADWSDIAPGTGQVRNFVVPRDLE